jgi:hypothetical protein
LSAVSSIGCDLLLSAIGFDWQQVRTMTRGALTGGLLIVLARAWFGLTIAATAVAVLRNRRAAPLIAGVSLFQAFGVMFVTVLPLVPFILGVAFLFSPSLFLAIVGSGLLFTGMMLMASYSVAGMIVMDGHHNPVAALESSAGLTRGSRGEILGLIALISFTGIAVMWLDAQMKLVLSAYAFGPPIVALLHVAMRVMLDLFGTCCIAALYYELDKVGTEVETGPRIPKYRGY